MSYEHITRVGKYTVRDKQCATEILSDGTLGIDYEELGRLERRAAITVLSEVELIDGGELKFARKALGLKQADLSARLGITTETLCRWETGKDPFKRITQLAVLQLLQLVEHHGEEALTRPLQELGKNLELRAIAS